MFSEQAVQNIFYIITKTWL